VTTEEVAPVNDLPNPYRTIENWAQIPDGRMGAVAAVAIDKDGKSIWALERCGANSCVYDPATGQMSTMDPILLFDESGKLIRRFGAGMLAGPHRIYCDDDGNIWVTDYQDNGPRAGTPGANGGGGVTTERATERPAKGATIGHQVFKFTPEGELLMTLGKPGGAVEGDGEPDYFYQPCDVLVGAGGAIFVSTGHGQGVPEVFKFTKDGKFIKRWGGLGSGPGEFDQAHSIAMDSKGRLYVGDRGNNRVQVFDQDGNYISETKAFSRPSGLFIDKDDNLYVADSESGSVARYRVGWRRGIRIGSTNDFVPRYFIPDPNEETFLTTGFTKTWSAEGVTVDAAGNLYGAEVGNCRLMRYEPMK
jgi:DNA-binding beta-propeller fold protein YncE